MKPYSDPISLQDVYEVCLPFVLKYLYPLIKNGKVELSTELFSEDEKDSYVDEAREIEICTTYKLRPVIVMSQSFIIDNSYLVMAITKVKGMINPEYLLAVSDNKIVERHLLPRKKYESTLKFDSLAMVDAIYRVTKNNFYYRRGRIKQDDYDAVRAKLKKILSG